MKHDDHRRLPLARWPGMVLGEIKAVPRVLRELELRYLALIISASGAAVVAGMVGKLARQREFILWLWGPDAADRLPFFTKIHWAGMYTIGYLVIPLLVMLIVLRESPKRYGLGLGKLPHHLPIYAFLAALAAPMVVIASRTDTFLAKYPKMPAVNLEEFLLLEGLYVLQFLALELFFRGFILFPSVRKFGLAGILVPVVPYCMLHFSKPIPEALGAIFAGLLLGYYAWKSRSIWGGVLLHSLVAVTMDTLAIVQKRGEFF